MSGAPKLYLVTRKDLGHGPQAVQMAHAITEFIMQYPEEAKEWYQGSNHLACLSVEDEDELRSLQLEAECRGILHAAFTEPDLDGQLTAVALEPAAKGLVRGLPLAMRGK